jgi:hypothetical protein
MQHSKAGQHAENACVEVNDLCDAASYSYHAHFNKTTTMMMTMTKMTPNMN